MIAGRFTEGQSQRPCRTGRGTLVAFSSCGRLINFFLLEVCMRFLAILLALALLGSTLVGCHAEGDVHGMTFVTPGR